MSASIRITPAQADIFRDLFEDTGCTLSSVAWSLDGRTLTVNDPTAAARALAGWIWDEDEAGTADDDIARIRRRNSGPKVGAE